MKRLISLVSVILMVSSAAQASELGEIMKQVGNQFKILAQGLQTQNITAVELEACEAMQRLVADASLIMPAKAQTTELQLRYANLMAQLMQKNLLLEDQLEAVVQGTGDVSAAFATFAAMNELRKEGHFDFKEEE